MHTKLIPINYWVNSESDDLDILEVTFDSMMTFGLPEQKVSIADSKRIGIYLEVVLASIS